MKGKIIFNLWNKCKYNSISLGDNVTVTYKSIDYDWNIYLKELRNLKVFNEKYLFDLDLYLPSGWSLQYFDSKYKSSKADFGSSSILSN